MAIWKNNADGLTWQIDGSGQTDSSATVQSAIDYMANSYGGGEIIIPPGNYLAKTGVTLKRQVYLRGSGRSCTALQCQNFDSSIITFDAACDYAGFSDLFVIGYTNSAATTNAVIVPPNVPVNLRRSKIWGGSSALWNRGVDGEIEDCFILGWNLASLISNGANWYKRCKFDTSGNQVQYAFFQGTPEASNVMENHFDQCDFSGNYQYSIEVNDGGTNTAISVFTGCVISAPIALTQARSTLFSACELGSSSFNSGNGSVSIVGSVAFSPLSVPAASKAGNINIS